MIYKKIYQELTIIAPSLSSFFLHHDQEVAAETVMADVEAETVMAAVEVEIVMAAVEVEIVMEAVEVEIAEMVIVDPDQVESQNQDHLESQDQDHLESQDQDLQENHPGQKKEASPSAVFRPSVFFDYPFPIIHLSFLIYKVIK